MRTSSRLAIVVCTYNRSESLLKTLSSIYDCGYSGPEAIEILVVANNCTDDTVARLETFSAEHQADHVLLRWIEEARAGKSHALNAAISATSNEALCFIDDDQTVEYGFVQALLEGMATYPNDAIYCGRIWPAWDGSEPAWVHTQGRYAIPIRPFPEYDFGPESVVIAPSDRFPSGGNITVRRDVFDTVGSFSVDLGPTGHNLAGGEDHDFIMRAVALGLTIRYLPRVRQLHAIDAERISTNYTLKKSFVRSKANFLLKEKRTFPRPYMARKIFSHLAQSAFTLDERKRFYFLVRLAASVGELSGGIDSMRMTYRRMPPDGISLTLLLLVGTALASAICAFIFAGPGVLQALLPAASVSALGTALILGKSMIDFSQTGPRAPSEIVASYRRYTIFALVRLSLWAFILLLSLAGVSTLLYWSGITALQRPWSSGEAVLASMLGIVLGSAYQFFRALRLNPGLLVASMHYRVSRLYSAWQWFTPMRLTIIGIAALACAVGVFAAAIWHLLENDRLITVTALLATLLSAGCAVIVAAWEPEARKPKRPKKLAGERLNVLMIGSDTLRADRLGCMGYVRRITPHIDQLAATGTLFTNCYVPCARTAPSVVSLLTGTWPHTNGIRDNFVPDEAARLQVADLPTLLSNIGYRTAAISDWCGADLGKFSFGFQHTELPEDQWNLKYLIRQGPKDLRLFLSLFLHNRIGRALLPEIYYLGGVPLTGPLGRRARRLVTRLADTEEPFFLNLFYSTTHPPFASEWPWYTKFADPDYRGESKFAMARLTEPFEIIRRQGEPREEFDLDQILALYDGCVAQFDDEVGKMLKHLDICGLSETTLVVLYSDHGMEFFEHETWGQGNSALGDFSARVPLIMAGPHIPTDQRIDQVVRTVDVMPTLLDVLDTPSVNCDGTSLLPAIRNPLYDLKLNAFNETGIWITNVPGLPEGHLNYPDLFHLLDVPDSTTGTLSIREAYRLTTLLAKDRMIREGRWKLVYQPLEDGVRLALYDVINDPGCTIDLSIHHAEEVKRLYPELLAWIRSDAALPVEDHCPV